VHEAVASAASAVNPMKVAMGVTPVQAAAIPVAVVAPAVQLMCNGQSCPSRKSTGSGLTDPA